MLIGTSKHITNNSFCSDVSAPSIGNESNFVVVFASDDYAHMTTRQPLPYDEKGTAIVCRLADKKPTFWDSWMPAVSP